MAATLPALQMTHMEPQRVVITGMGLISPLGNDPNTLMENIKAGRSGIGPMQQAPHGPLPCNHAAEAREFTGAIDDFGPLEKDTKRAIRKGQKLMCREIEMGVAAAQLALHDAGLSQEGRDRDRTGVVFGCDLIMTLPEEFSTGIDRCLSDGETFEFSRWAEAGLPQVNPLWLLKYLPNMPASHIAIYNDLRGPNNSLTLREASSCAAVAEAHSTIARGHADALIVGATGSKTLAFRALHSSMQETLAKDRANPSEMSQPFGPDRDGEVLGEGASAIICESLEHAQRRGAKILAEVVGFGTSSVAASQPGYQQVAIGNALKAALKGSDPSEVGHVHAHGLSDQSTDAQEAQALAACFGEGEAAPPVIAAKSYFGNLGAASGMVETILSVMCLNSGQLFPTLNVPAPASDCPVRLATADTPAGDSFVSVNVTPQGQASAIRVAKFAG